MAYVQCDLRRFALCCAQNGMLNLRRMCETKRMSTLSLRETRLAMGLTLEEMASKTEAGRSCLSRMEAEHRLPRPYKLVRIADGYGVSLEQLVGSILAKKAETPNPPKGPPKTRHVDLRNKTPNS